MEATGDYWKGVYYLLEAEGFDCWLVNPREVKNVPGRAKTDRADAGVAGQGRRTRYVLAVADASATDPGVAGPDPLPARPGAGPDPGDAAGGEASRRRPDQDRVGVDRHPLPCPDER